MFTRISLLLTLLYGLSFSMTSHAGPIVTWTIENANFANGTLSGSFTLDYISPTLPLVTAVNITTTATPVTYFAPSNSYTFNSNDYYALVPLQHNVDCSGALPSEACPYVQLYGVNTNSLQTGTLTATLLNLVFATNLPMTGGTVQMLMSKDVPIAGAGSPPGSSCVASIQCTSEEAFVGAAQTIPPFGTPTEYRGLLDPPEGPYVVGTVQAVPLPASWLLLASSAALFMRIDRRVTALFAAKHSRN